MRRTTRLHRWVRRTVVVAIGGIALLAQGSVAASSAGVSDPETVMITLRAKPGMEADLARVIAKHWTTAKELNLVRETGHVTIRASDDQGTYFLDVFTWKDADVPDHPPAAILAIWTDMNRLTEARGGRPGLEIKEVTLVGPVDRD